MAWPDGEDFCPKCHADLDGGPIPEQHLAHYGGRTRYSRRISVYSREEDRHLVWKCPNCGHQWE